MADNMNPDRDTELTEIEVRNMPMDAICGRCDNDRGAHYNGWCPLPGVGNRSPLFYVNGIARVHSHAPGQFTWKKRAYYKGTLLQKISSTAGTAPTADAVNDHVCPTCKNNRVSKQEKSCWLCGSPL